MMIAKAYEALTDPESKENWEKYGNPDGKQPMEMGIGLPSWVMEPENRNVVMIMYLFGLVVCIPRLCGSTTAGPASTWILYSPKRTGSLATGRYSPKTRQPRIFLSYFAWQPRFRDMAEMFNKDRAVAQELARLEKQLKRDGMPAQVSKNSWRQNRKVLQLLSRQQGRLHSAACALVPCHRRRETYKAE